MCCSRHSPPYARSNSLTSFATRFHSSRIPRCSRLCSLSSPLGPLFISAVRNGVTREFEDASDVWSRTLESREASRTRSQSGPSARKKPSQLFLPSTTTITHTSPTPAQLESIASSPPNVPPPVLASYPPLAVFTNALLSALNGLRLLAPASLLHDLLNALDGALARATTSLLSYMRASADDRNNSTTTPSAEEKKREEDVVRAVGTVYVKVFIPFVRRALVEGVYGIKVGDLQAKSEMIEDLRRAVEELQGQLEENVDA
ncbi:hypothetical protein NUW54_g305 [Trametes sanguinea]|uniref:Uncharacterized protein n=1 Tax=Trametes sanguinea TaxID=158606 RepID=A0ACC1Q9J8_9APHY|nr:hypothetical protein NUW54_g305 [Trametes sanguinea]